MRRASSLVKSLRPRDAPVRSEIDVPAPGRLILTMKQAALASSTVYGGGEAGEQKTGPSQRMGASGTGAYNRSGGRGSGVRPPHQDRPTAFHRRQQFGVGRGDDVGEQVRVGRTAAAVAYNRLVVSSDHGARLPTIRQPIEPARSFDPGGGKEQTNNRGGDAKS